MESGATVILVLICLVSLLGLFVAPQIVNRCLFRPYWLVRRGEYSTLISSGFVHADVGHLIFNAFTFYSFAFFLERAIGTTRFVLLYFAGLLLGNLGTYVKHRNNPNYSTLGASGAILAVLFASIVYFPSQRLFIIPIPVPIPAPLFALGYLAYSYYSARQSRGKINHDAHLGGALTGLGFVAVTDPGAYRNLMATVFN
jgi:membrane associated rhomboid family serine protease